jgi:plastocyanin
MSSVHSVPATLRSPLVTPWRIACLAQLVTAIVIGALLLFLSACGSSSSSAPSAMTVTIQNFIYHPARFTVRPGATITVVNDDQVIHTLTADGGRFNSGDVTNGVPATFQAPKQPGTYPFHDRLRPYMTGILTVS